VEYGGVSTTLALALALLSVVLLSSVTRWSEVVVAVPAAAVLTASGAISTADAASEITRLLPVVIFLGTLLLLSGVCDDEGLFRVFGDWMAHSSTRDPRMLLRRVFLLASATTAVLSLDATVVLLTPVVVGAARALRISRRPHVYATAHLANSASLLLPVSNLTNLLAFSAAGLSFAGFTALMASPWLAVIAAEYLLFRMVFRRDLVPGEGLETIVPAQKPPVFVLVVLLLTLVGFAVTSWCGLSPAWAALAGAVVLGARSLAQGRSTVGGLARSVNLQFLIFVLALGVVVKAVLVNGVESWMGRVLPTGTGLLSLLGIAAIAALLSNVVNNLPATLILLAPLTVTGPAGILAALIGLNIGPNLTYVGSLSNLLWRRVLHQRGEQTSAVEFTAIGLLTVPICLVVAVVMLWAGVRLAGI
jgi:arsenical pump membrane protein